MNIEDLILALTYTAIRLNPWDEKLVYSFSDQIGRGNGFTEKQSVLALKIINRHSADLSSHLKKDVSSFLKNPVFRLPIRQISSSKKLTVVPSPVFGKSIRAIFPYNEKIVHSIRENKEKIGNAIWDKDNKCWEFPLNEASLQFLMEMSANEQFEVDENFKDLEIQTKNIISNMENYVPMLVIEDKVPKLKNCHSSVPELTETDLMTSIFEARKRGIFAWDETIAAFINSDEVHPTTRKLLQSDAGEKLEINSQENEISCIEDIIKYLRPCLFIIPGGSEYENLKFAHQFLTSIGIKNKNMSVMFRLPNESHKSFNDFVKENELNSPISDDTEIIFISGKLPKPVLKSGIKFHSVINLGYNNVHYSMRDFVARHENLVFYSTAKEIRRATIGFM
jgi:hypothetical protein